MGTAKQIKSELVLLGDEMQATHLSRFFKTGQGQYGEGDLFYGIKVPVQREIVKKYASLELSEIKKLIYDPYHECRLTGWLFLVNMFEKSKIEREKESYYLFYIEHKRQANNWDLVDLTCPRIVGGYLQKRDRAILREWAKDGDLWTQRIAIVCNWYLIREGIYKDTFDIADILLVHPHDLIHKAVGWMLREVGKRNFEAEYEFLIDEGRYKRMPRTMLRYAIEKFDQEMRQDFLKGRL